MAGAIARAAVLGTAPAARRLPCRRSQQRRHSGEARPSTSSRASTGRPSKGARVINMSFAGPQDPSLERALKRAYDKGIVLIAAAGNAGAEIAAALPGADPT